MHNKKIKNWLSSSYLSKHNQSYIEKIYEDFLINPHSIDSSWHKIFEELSTEQALSFQIIDKNQEKDDITSDTNISNYVDQEIDCRNNLVYAQIFQLIYAFRKYGYQHAALDPLQLSPKKSIPTYLELQNYDFTTQNLQQTFNVTPFGLQEESITLTEIHSLLKKIYTNHIGIEYMHISDNNTILWIQNNFESKQKISSIHNQEKKQFLEEIIAAEGIEHYLGTKFPGVKRFSLEGGEALIPMLKEIIRYSVISYNSKEIFFGMAHRGRLNVLVNVLGKSPKELFNEFSNVNNITFGSGDVKYHKGFHSEITMNGHTIHLSLLCNPSHLEIISPVVMGAVRARFDKLYRKSNNDNNIEIQNNVLLPIIIHGDAAISAQGIVQETFNMSKTRAYDVGGMIHIVINNQIGFTTSNIHDARSTQYCTDIAKMTNTLILHVNADNVEAVISVARFALDFRNKFKQDVIIDLVCYRRHGHNEADDPSVTQPIMYKKIRNHPTLLNIYSNVLDHSGIVSINNKKAMIESYQLKLDTKDCMLEQWTPVYVKSTYYTQNHSHVNNSILNLQKINTQELQELAYLISKIPSNITVHDRVKKIFNDRMEMAAGNKLFDWGAAENLAYATLLSRGISIRISGEDTARGTFFHRHAIIYDQDSGSEYIPLMNIKKNQGSLFLWDSVLSEEATVAFEYGYSHMSNDMLVIWEAQFGDFANGAQIVIDQFISSSEQKWGKICGLVLLLPHGYEGQGPEHSSARVERYLQLCAEQNMKVCVPSTPAQIYHILRQQAICDIKKPLIIITPKSLLRNPMVMSSLEDFAYGSFKTIFNEIDNNVIPHQVNRLIICTGKIYYDLLKQRCKDKKFTTSIIRIEQLYPFPEEEIQILLSVYSNIQCFVWCQEEPKNQGAWNYIQNYFHSVMPKIKLHYVGRPDAAAPAVGYLSVHLQQQKKIIEDALTL